MQKYGRGSLFLTLIYARRQSPRHNFTIASGLALKVLLSRLSILSMTNKSVLDAESIFLISIS